MKKKLPNLFIIGTAKSGTSSMYQYLREHNDIYGSSKKEPRFLTKDNLMKLPISKDEAEKIISSQEKYMELYKEATDEKYIIDGSVYTIFFKEALEKLKNLTSEYKIIVMLRNPVDRFISHYKMAYLLGQVKIPVEKFIKTPICGMGLNSLELGLYYNQIQTLYEILDKDNIKVIIFDDFKENTKDTLSSVYDFLDISSSILDSSEAIHFKSPGVARVQVLHNLYMKNKMVVKIKKLFINTKLRNIKKYIHKFLYKKADVSQDIYAFLYQYYKEDILKLEKLLDTNLDRWKHKHE